MKLILQKHDGGCGIACIAMVTGKPYDEVAESFTDIFEKEGMTTDVLVDYITDMSYSAIKKEVLFYDSVSFGRKEILAPFAPAHVLHVKQYVDSKYGHFVAMDKRGKLYCPSGNLDADVRNFYQINACIGFWPT